MIKFLDLHKLNSRFETELQLKFQDFLNSGYYVLGNEVSAFEEEYANYCGTKYCIGVSSGLDALHLILESYKLLGLLSDGDEIIVPANTYIATVLAVSHKGLKPILVEPDPKTFNINPNEIEKAITAKTKAILGVHLYGRLYEVEALKKIAKDNGLLLIEDAAQAHGAVNQDGLKAGNVSDAAAFSFYPTKNLGALGEAGAITTNNKELADIAIKLRNYGRASTYKNDYKGFNCRLDEIQAAFLRVKLKWLDRDNDKRLQIAKTYLKGINNKSIVLPEGDINKQHVYHQFIIRSKKRDMLKEYLLKNVVETTIHYPIPIHKQNAFEELGNLSFPITEVIHKEVLSIPINPVLSSEDVEKIISLINRFS
ncbi:DegT/DnrJ/EryC1/StrS aminotransferase family protein [Seonamhaeicola sp. ML3]|uniref:DegT/DnrJ/EryC1/StrS family aminotransferase n=1 Tax=Seonamhaeicola sp. ML3 TaxID=2937786 RepID=UPI00200C5DD9|nr:DegT/DnrJ/EryC1/StrS family aminotransferase [Seonamhaeicola sp. ML3]